jgi:hypothetical protein
VPCDVSSAYSHYLWASHLGHAKASLCAANMIYEQYVLLNTQQQSYDTQQLQRPYGSTATGTGTNMGTSIPSDLNYALQLYLEAATATGPGEGLPEAMNAYAMLIEEGNGIDFPSNVTERDRMMEAAKWYHAAMETEKPESQSTAAAAAGNLLLLVTKYPYLSHIETVDGRQISLPELKRWLHSLSSNLVNNPTVSAVYEALKVSEEQQPQQQQQWLQEEEEEEVKDHRHTPFFPQTSSSSLRYLYSKNRPTQLSPHQHSHKDDGVLAKLEIFPEDRIRGGGGGGGGGRGGESEAEYLANKLKSFSKFSLTSDLLARKMEFCDAEMKWNQQRDSETHRRILKNRSRVTTSQSLTQTLQPRQGQGQGQQQQQSVGKGRPLPAPPPQSPSQRQSEDFKNVSKFVQMSNHFKTKPESHRDRDRERESDPRDSQRRPGTETGAGAGAGAGAEKGARGGTRRGRGGEGEEKEDGSEEESSELDMEKMAKIRHSHQTQAQVQDIHELLSNSEFSEDSDLPALTHQQDRQVPPLSLSLSLSLSPSLSLTHTHTLSLLLSVCVFVWLSVCRVCR